MNISHSLQSIEKAIEKAGEKYKVISLFSGGHDSLCATHVASQSKNFDGVLHIDTGIGIPETQQFVIDICNQFSWQLQIYRATEDTYANGEPYPQIYEELVLKRGFPPPIMHSFFYFRLKGRQIDRYVRDAKKDGFDSVVFISGVRKAESSRRTKNIIKSGEVHKDGSKIWVANIANWSALDCQEYMKENSLPRNPVKDILCMSGECLCGAFAKPGDLEVLEACFPETGKRLRDIEEKVKQSGFPWGWDEKPPKWWKAYQDGQQFIPGLEQEFLPLCTSCSYKHELGEKESTGTF